MLRLPGLHNHKYGHPYLVRVETLATDVHGPDQFPVFTAEDYEWQPSAARPKRIRTGITQSERDWSYAKRALAQGDSPESVIAAIASYRHYDKHHPTYYAELTAESGRGAQRRKGA